MRLCQLKTHNSETAYLAYRIQQPIPKPRILNLHAFFPEIYWFVLIRSNHKSEWTNPGKGTIQLLHQQKDWMGGSRKWPVQYCIYAAIVSGSVQNYAVVISGWSLRKSYQNSPAFFAKNRFDDINNKLVINNYYFKKIRICSFRIGQCILRA